MHNILIIDSAEPATIDLARTLSFDGYVVELVADPLSARRALKTSEHDYLIWRMPVEGIDHCEALRAYRANSGNGAIIAIVDPCEWLNIPTILKAGADDFVKSPIRTREVMLRIKSSVPTPTVRPLHQPVRISDIELDPLSGTVTKAGTTIHLFPMEFFLLNFLAQHPNQAFSSEALAARVWRNKERVSSETVRTHIKTLRRKIDTPGEPSIIKTDRRGGYRLCS